MELMQANRQWMSRPADERFLDLLDMRDHFEAVRAHSRAVVRSTHQLKVAPIAGDHFGLEVQGANGIGYTPTHWAFSQLCRQAEAPTRFLRTLPAALVADTLNYKLLAAQTADDVGLLLHRENDKGTLRAVTGPNYGRVWNMDFVSTIVDQLGDGRTGDFRVPGQFGKEVEVTKNTTTLYASDENCFIFLADEKNQIDLPNRRDGKDGKISRGIFFWNSEVGDGSIGMAFFLFDYMCCNHIVWGVQDFNEIRIRHTASAPDRWIDQMVPVIERFAQSPVEPIAETLKAAQAKRIGDKLDDFLATRFSKDLVEKIKTAHQADEHRPMETVWDVVTGATAFARQIKNVDERLKVETQAGKLLDLVAA